MAKTNPVTVRLDLELHQQASAIAKVTGETFRELLERGLRREVEGRLRDDAKLAQTVEALRAYGGATR